MLEQWDCGGVSLVMQIISILRVLRVISGQESSGMYSITNTNYLLAYPNHSTQLSIIMIPYKHQLSSIIPQQTQIPLILLHQASHTRVLPIHHREQRPCQRQRRLRLTATPHARSSPRARARSRRNPARRRFRRAARAPAGGRATPRCRRRRGSD